MIDNIEFYKKFLKAIEFDNDSFYSFSEKYKMELIELKKELEENKITNLRNYNMSINVVEYCLNRIIQLEREIKLNKLLNENL